MKRLTSLLLVLFSLSGTILAQNATDELLGRIRNNRISFGYNFSSDGTVPYSGKGRVIVQGAMYVCEMEDGGKIWSDGKTRWTLDRDAREIYIEDVASSPDILSNPEPFLTGLRDLSVSKDGKSLSGVYDNGKMRIKVGISSIAELPVATAAFFRPDLGKYSSTGWTVTDLR